MSSEKRTNRGEKMNFNYSKLLGKIKEVYGTHEKFASAMGMSKVSLSQRLNNKLDFSQSDIDKAIQILNINKKDIDIFFFNK